MASYQDIDTRLRVIEDKVEFVLKTARIKFGVTSGLVGPDGQPAPMKVHQGSLLEAYQLSRQFETLKQSEIEPPVLEQENG